MGQKGNAPVDEVNLINVLCQWKSVYMTHHKKSTQLEFFFLIWLNNVMYTLGKGKTSRRMCFA